MNPPHGSQGGDTDVQLTANVDLGPLIGQIIEQTLRRLQDDHAKVDGRLAFPEAEAAQLLGIPAHSLRDARLRGDVEAVRIGKRWLYTRDELLRLLGQAASNLESSRRRAR